MGKHVTIVAATERNASDAAALLIFTKSTRLKLSGALLEDIQHRCHSEPDWMMSELSYMAKTIRSSWEFLDVTFNITDVSRACAQQITRTRFTPIDGDLFGSYAMQSQRVTDMSEATWHNPYRDGGKEDKFDLEGEFDSYMREAMGNYAAATSESMSDESDAMDLEDARGVLPVNLHCSLIAKYNLRMLVDLVQARSSYRAQGEFNVIAAEMRAELVAMWPWAELFLKPRDELAKSAIEDLTLAIKDAVNAHDVKASYTHDIMIKLAKVNDLLQGG